MADLSAILATAQKNGVDMSWVKAPGQGGGSVNPQVQATGQGVQSLTPGAQQLMDYVRQAQAANPVRVPFAAGTPTLQAKNAAEAARGNAASELFSREQFDYSKGQDAISNALAYARANSSGGGGGGTASPDTDKAALDFRTKVLGMAMKDQGWVEGDAIYREGLMNQYTNLLLGIPNQPEPVVPEQVKGNWAQEGLKKLFPQLYGQDVQTTTSTDRPYPEIVPREKAKAVAPVSNYTDADIRATIKVLEQEGNKREDIMQFLKSTGLDPTKF